MSTHPAPGGQPLDVSEAADQLNQASSIVDTLSKASAAHCAESLQQGQDALRAFKDAAQHEVSGQSSGGRTAGGGTGTANAFKEPIMLMASPAGIALSTQQSAQITADEQINLVSGENLNIAGGKSLIASVTEKLSFFVQNAGMKLFAARGKYTNVWSVAADGSRAALTAQSPTPERGYEYKLYERSVKLYPDCPSDGYELLRFGRILSPQPTLATGAERTTWVRLTFAQGQEGYIDVSNDAITKLSDADFPILTGWKKITEGNTPYSNDGMCDVDELKKILGDAEATSALSSGTNSVNDESLTSYVKGNVNVRASLRRFICEAPTEWDSSQNDARYGQLNMPDGFYGKQQLTNPNGYRDFLDLLNKFQFWDKTGLPSGNIWFFHPLQFIRHFRKCGWLSQNEMAQCFPHTLLHLKHTQFLTSTLPWSTAFQRSDKWGKSFNITTRKYGIGANKLRILHLLSHVIPETQNLGLVSEVGGSTQSYAPYYGRGLIQLTHLDNYQDYGTFRNFNGTGVPSEFHTLGWDPNELIARDNNGHHNYNNCADSAGFYIVKRNNMLRHMDAGATQDDATTVSKDVNGYVAIENLNGLEVRLQSVVYLRSVLLDDLFEGSTVSITFDWRRNSDKEPVLDEQGHVVMIGTPPRPKIKFYKTQHTIQASLQRQQP